MCRNSQQPCRLSRKQQTLRDLRLAHLAPMNSLLYRHEGPYLLHPNHLFNLEVKSFFVLPVAYKRD